MITSVSSLPVHPPASYDQVIASHTPQRNNTTQQVLNTPPHNLQYHHYYPNASIYAKQFCVQNSYYSARTQNLHPQQPLLKTYPANRANDDGMPENYGHSYNAEWSCKNDVHVNDRENRNNDLLLTEIKAEKPSLESCLNSVSGFSNVKNEHHAADQQARDSMIVKSDAGNHFVVKNGMSSKEKIAHKELLNGFSVVSSSCPPSSSINTVTTNIEITRIMQPGETNDNHVTPPVVSLQNYSSTSGSTWTARHYYPKNKNTSCIIRSGDSASDSSNQEKTQSQAKTGMMVDDSLTNIAWLGKLSSGVRVAANGTSNNKCKSPTNQYENKDLRRIASDKQIEEISRECGRDKRPPFSYMHLIQLAISSSKTKRMTLREIYQWIADKFPYYRYSTRQGWKNSIRHNLSLYDIFVRQKPNDVPGQNGASYWTLRPDVPPRSKSGRSQQSQENSQNNKQDKNPPPTVLPVLPNDVSVINPATGLQHPIMIMNNAAQVSMPLHATKIKSRKGPAPLLPKLPTVQTYALIPIQGILPITTTSSKNPLTPSVTPLTTTALNHPPAHVHTPDQEIQPENKTMSSKRPHSPTSSNKRKHIKIAPKFNPLNENIISQAWVNANSSVESFNSTNNSLSQTRYDSGLGFSMLHKTLDGNNSVFMSSPIVSCSKAKSRTKPKSELPKPKMYKHKPAVISRKKHKNKPTHIDDVIEMRVPGNLVSQTNPEGVTENSLSESGIGDILANFEKDFSSPMRSLLETPPCNKSAIKTSTPCKPAPHSPQWCSPIRGITPLANLNNVFENGLCTPLRDNDFNKKSPCSMENSKLNTPNFYNHQKRQNGQILSSINQSPKLWSKILTSSPKGFSVQGVTPLNPQTSTGSSNLNSSMHNQSLNKVFADFHLENILDADDMSLDVGNLSWSCLMNSLS